MARNYYTTLWSEVEAQDNASNISDMVEISDNIASMDIIASGYADIEYRLCEMVEFLEANGYEVLTSNYDILSIDRVG